MLLCGLSWAFYENLLLEIGEQRLYVTYDRGNLEIMAPSPYHERYKTLIGRLIETLTLELNIPIVGGSSTTFKRKDPDRGFEPDECYYVQHEREVREKFELDLLRDPSPPDLGIEMDYTHHELDRESIYAAFRVPEIWRFDLRTLRFSIFSPTGSAITGRSLAFPFLPMEKVE